MLRANPTHIILCTEVRQPSQIDWARSSQSAKTQEKNTHTTTPWRLFHPIGCLLQISNQLQQKTLFCVFSEDAKVFFWDLFWKVSIWKLASFRNFAAFWVETDTSSQWRNTFQIELKKPFASSFWHPKRCSGCNRFEICSNMKNRTLFLLVIMTKK